MRQIFHNANIERRYLFKAIVQFVSLFLFSIKGLPVFAADNKRIQESAIDTVVEIKVKIYSSSLITCHNITVGNMLIRLQDMKVRMQHILIKEHFHDAIVTVKGFEIIFALLGLNFRRSLEFNVTVCNTYGESSLIVNSVGKFERLN